MPEYDEVAGYGPEGMGPPAPRKKPRKKGIPTMQPLPQLGPQGGPRDLSSEALERVPRVASEPPGTVPESERPSEKMKKRQEAKEKEKTFGESLLELSASVPQGRGKYTRMLSAGLSGAAVGASLGEALAKLYAKKKGKGRKPPTMGEAEPDPTTIPEMEDTIDFRP